MKTLPIRVRLTLWYFAMFASAATLLCLASLWMLRRSLDVTEYHDLQERAEDVQEVLSHESPDNSLAQITEDFAAIYNLKDDGKYLQVRDEQGNWVYRSKRMIAENPGLPAPGLIQTEGLISEFHQGTRYVRILAYPIEVRGKHYSVQTGIALNKSMVLLANFRTNLLLLTPIVILLAAAGGHFMSRKALRPVAALAAEARLINDRNLDIRLPVPAAKDEISDLSQTLNQMLERIDKAFASVRTFTGNASHELRTPISLLRTEIEVALYRPRDVEEYRAVLGRLYEETVRMTSLVDNLLSLARTDGGAETILLVPIRVDDLFRQTSEVWKSAMNQAMLDFRVEAPKEELIVLGDKHLIPRLLSILLENASKYTPPGGSVKLCAAIIGTRIVLSVEDTGIGISPQHKLRIFDRFYRVAPVGGPMPAGSGLGLALGKWIAERHGTELCVESDPGCGTRFSIGLERTYADPPANQPFGALNEGSKADPKLPSPRTL
ncbi:MAG: ATP-binding protein [Terracidiphilus sp.]|jgi:heavy metal sensor kinase